MLNEQIIKRFCEQEETKERQMSHDDEGEKPYLKQNSQETYDQS